MNDKPRIVIKPPSLSQLLARLAREVSATAAVAERRHEEYLEAHHRHMRAARELAEALRALSERESGH